MPMARDLCHGSGGRMTVCLEGSTMMQKKC